jgi:hypothetical protein
MNWELEKSFLLRLNKVEESKNDWITATIPAICKKLNVIRVPRLISILKQRN